ncbi:hypothetical protein [Treponema sp. R6D11]
MRNTPTPSKGDLEILKKNIENKKPRRLSTEDEISIMEVAQGFIEDGDDELTNLLAHMLGVYETMSSQASNNEDLAKALQTQRVLWIAEKDERMCKKCEEYSERTFLLKDIPPAHPNCRCGLEINTDESASLSMLVDGLLITYIEDNGIIRFDFDYNDFLKIVLCGKGLDLAEKLYHNLELINPDYLSGRSISGLYTELLLHWAAYSLGIKPDSSHQADMGGLTEPGFDDNGIVFEAINATWIISQLLKGNLSIIGNLAKQFIK